MYAKERKQMLFQVVLNEDWVIKHRIMVEKIPKNEIFHLLRGTVSDVYGIFGELFVSNTYNKNNYMCLYFIIYHKSLPCFYSCNINCCRPAIRSKIFKAHSLYVSGQLTLTEKDNKVCNKIKRFESR